MVFGIVCHSSVIFATLWEIVGSEMNVPNLVSILKWFCLYFMFLFVGGKIKNTAQQMLSGMCARCRLLRIPRRNSRGELIGRLSGSNKRADWLHWLEIERGKQVVPLYRTFAAAWIGYHLMWQWATRNPYINAVGSASRWDLGVIILVTGARQT